MFIGSLRDNRTHRHHAIQLCIALNEPFRLVRETGSGHYRAAIIASDVAHRFQGDGGRHILLLVEPESTAGRHLTHGLLETTAIVDLESLFDARQLERMVPPADSGPSLCRLASHLRDYILDTLGFEQRAPVAMDPRIQKAVMRMRAMETKKMPARELAAELAISESRLIHLFTEQIGIPIRPYLRWLRLIEAVKTILTGRSLTEAAHAAGFADSAHLSRTFRLMFGFSPSDILKNDRFVQAVSCAC